MFHFFEAIQNKSGDALPGYLVKVFDSSTGAIVPLYSDNSATPIVNVSGIDDTAVVDDNGNASFYIEHGTYDLGIYSPSGVQKELIPDYPLGSSTVTLASGAAVSTRALLAGIDSPAALQQATLTEAGREGVFVFDSSNLSAKVTADTAQGIYVAPSTDTTGASGAWVRKFTGPPSVKFFGAVGDGTTVDLTAINTAITTLNTLGVASIKFDPGHTFYLGAVGPSLTFGGTNMIVEGHGATITSALPTGGAAVFFTGSGTKVRGLSIHLTDTTSNAAYVNVQGANVHFTDVTIQRDQTSAIPMYLSAGADGFEWRGGELYAYGGLNAMSVSHVLIDGVYFHQPDGSGTDDSIAIKAFTAEVVDWRIANCRYRNKSNFVAIGSEVGTPAANDSTYSKGVYGVEVVNCYGENCTTVLYIKPGLQYDYRDGTVENVSVTNCHLRDVTGAFARNLAFITACRGARVRRIQMTNCTARYRCPDRSGSGNAGILILGSTITGGTAASEIDQIFFNEVAIADPFNGAASGTAGTSGYPIDNFIIVDASTGGGGTPTAIKRVEINNLHGDGCARSGMSVTSSASVTGPLVVRNPVFTNYSAAELGSADRAAIVNSSKVEVHGLTATPSSSAVAGTRGVMGDNQPDKTIEIVGEKSGPVAFATVAAGNTGTGTIFTAPVDCWIRKIEIVCSAATTQSDTNYTTLSIVNRDTSGTLVAATTKVTGGIAITTFAPVSLNGTTQFTGANAYIRKGFALAYAKAETGTGAAITNPAFIVHYVPYGVA